MSRTLCFGELLLRLSPALGGEWLRKHSMPFYVGGAELNVATALARWGNDVGYVTALPENALADEILVWLNKTSIDVSKVQRSGERIGCYYLPQGTDLKNSGVIYDRAHSAFSELQPGVLDWNAILDGVDWFHFSAISPALNENLVAVCQEGVAAAQKKGISISVDLNYRAKLWQFGKLPIQVMPALVSHADVIMGNLWAAEKMLGTALPKGWTPEYESTLNEAEKTSQDIFRMFPRCKKIAFTFRFDESEGTKYYATLSDRDNTFSSVVRQTKEVKDKVGTGDSFMAGLIHGLRQQWNPERVIEFASAAGFSKFFIEGDATTASPELIETYL